MYSTHTHAYIKTIPNKCALWRMHVLFTKKKEKRPKKELWKMARVKQITWYLSWVIKINRNSNSRPGTSWVVSRVASRNATKECFRVHSLCVLYWFAEILLVLWVTMDLPLFYPPPTQIIQWLSSIQLFLNYVHCWDDCPPVHLSVCLSDRPSVHHYQYRREEEC